MKIVLCALAGLALSTEVASAQMVTASDPKTVAAALQEAGYKAALKKEKDGFEIASSSGGSDFWIFFYNCDDAKENCKTIQFYTGYPEKPSLETLNEFNRDNRFTRAYAEKEGKARLEMDLDLDKGGITRALFSENIATWASLMGKFEKAIGR